MPVSGLRRSRSEPALGSSNSQAADGQPALDRTLLHAQKSDDRRKSPPPEPEDHSLPPLARLEALAHRRKHDPPPEWHEEWKKDTWAHGRVLLIDYISGGRKVVAQEFIDIDSLRRFYRDPQHVGQAALRVVHVQNASWAVNFLSRKFNFDGGDSMGILSGQLNEHRRSKFSDELPFLQAKSTRVLRDPWRGIVRAAFACDYLKQHGYPVSGNQAPLLKVRHYNWADQQAEDYQVHVQRLSVYVQVSDGESGHHMMPNPYNEEAFRDYQKLETTYVHPEKFRSLDNGSTIIIFDHSAGRQVRDALIGARQEIESQWRRLTFYLPRDVVSQGDDLLTAECINLILNSVLGSVIQNWDRLLNVCETHVSILEGKVYRNPADESRATELWKSSAQWMNVSRLLYLHANFVKTIGKNILEITDLNVTKSGSWTVSVQDEFERLVGEWDRNIVQRTAALSDLMFKSVAFRDARDSLQLNTSMWRLSWITFIFLPLTFTVGFFGMNVDTFESNPSIKWWFVASIITLCLVITLWYAVKHSLSSSRKAPLRRGVYEAMYKDFATKHPSLWTHQGPRDVQPIGLRNLVKWRVLTSWFGADKVRPGPAYNPVTEDFGAWSDTKRWLARRWLANIDPVKVSMDIAA